MRVLCNMEKEAFLPSDKQAANASLTRASTPRCEPTPYVSSHQGFPFSLAWSVLAKQTFPPSKNPVYWIGLELAPNCVTSTYKLPPE